MKKSSIVQKFSVIFLVIIFFELLFILCFRPNKKIDFQEKNNNSQIEVARPALNLQTLRYLSFINRGAVESAFGTIKYRGIVNSIKSKSGVLYGILYEKGIAIESTGGINHLLFTKKNLSNMEITNKFFQPLTFEDLFVGDLITIYDQFELSGKIPYENRRIKIVKE
ncbi:MAG: hypothetical protein Q7T54_02785 [Candidatus Levybacteria bacterium]|nr:hypothetical protein [Candidatus Levybacteria bacterium]